VLPGAREIPANAYGNIEVLKGNTSQLPIGTVWVDLPFAIQVNRARMLSNNLLGHSRHSEWY
jgi:hypothetical protein